jgi:hypothetical protein
MRAFSVRAASMTCSLGGEAVRAGLTELTHTNEYGLLANTGCSRFDADFVSGSLHAPKPALSYT